MPAGLRPKSKSLSSFNVLPRAYFAEIDRDENTILMLRAHPITLIPWIFNTIFGIAAIIAFVDTIAGIIFLTTPKVNKNVTP